MYKTKDNEEYKTTTIRIRKDHYNKLKDIAINDHRSTNYIINLSIKTSYNALSNSTPEWKPSKLAVIIFWKASIYFLPKYKKKTR